MRDMWDKIVELLRESTLIQGTITLVCIVTMAILYLTNRQVPQTLVDVIFMIVGYYFGSKAAQRMLKGR